MRRRSSRLLLIGAAIAAAAWGGIAPVASEARTAAPPVASFARRMLAAHHIERAAARTPPVVWDEGLARAVTAYARQLSARGNVLRHSPASTRPGIGENLWMGTRGANSVEQMVARWAAEKAVFRPRVFPAVSSTGRWSDVAHYTQIIWRDTRRIGCGMASSAHFDILVCRYWPAGNMYGRPVL